MSRRLLLLASTVLAAVGVTSEAQAQTGVIGSYSPPNVQRRPTVSPYLNLLQSGQGAINYYGIVRPQMAMNQQINSLQRMSGVGGPGVPGPAADPYLQFALGDHPTLQQPPLLQTGHATQFQNHLGYFQGNQGPGLGVGAGPNRQNLGSPGGSSGGLGRSSVGTALGMGAMSGGVIRR